MNIRCPHCDFAKDIPESEIPKDTTRVNCPKCGQSFPFGPPEISEFSIDGSSAPRPVRCGSLRRILAESGGVPDRFPGCHHDPVGLRPHLAHDRHPCRRGRRSLHDPHYLDVHHRDQPRLLRMSKKGSVKKAVLAYSGGLDTSIILKLADRGIWL
jgi:predicted Zn finger-like uncharacterized protein